MVGYCDQVSSDLNLEGRSGISVSPLPEPSLTESEAQALVARLMSLRPQSAFALRAAVMALETQGVEGTLTMKIAKGTKDWPDLTFNTQVQA